MTVFTYQEFTTRNLGFVSEDEQTHLRNASVFVCGTGGMGGSAIMTLIRAGVGRLILADLDAFEVSNLNRQLFATLKTVNQSKAQETRDQCLQLNPEADIEVLGADLTDHVGRLVQSADYRGWFLNPHSGKVERPSPSFIAALMRPLVRRQGERLLTT